jgi:hypothetical protein
MEIEMLYYHGQEFKTAMQNALIHILKRLPSEMIFLGTTLGMIVMAKSMRLVNEVLEPKIAKIRVDLISDLIERLIRGVSVSDNEIRNIISLEGENTELKKLLVDNQFVYAVADLIIQADLMQAVFREREFLLAQQLVDTYSSQTIVSSKLSKSIEALQLELKLLDTNPKSELNKVSDISKVGVKSPSRGSGIAPHLFLSYAHIDKQKVFQLHSELENSTGHYIWVDKEELSSGIEWEKSIRFAIEDCYGVILALTKSFFTRPFIVTKEIPWIINRFKREIERGESCIFPVLLEEFSFSDLSFSSLDEEKEAKDMYDWIFRFQAVSITNNIYKTVADDLGRRFPTPTGGNHQFIVNWPRLRSFQGRNDLLKHLHYQLKVDNTHGNSSVVLNGLGGVGKTQLAVEYAYRYRFHYPGGIYWINGVHEWKKEIEHIGDRLRLTPSDPYAPDRSSQMVAAFNTYLREQPRKSLIIIDNVEDPDEVTYRQLGPLKLIDLPASILVTSRRATLPYGFTALNIGTFSDDIESARDILLSARPTEEDIQAVDRICSTRLPSSCTRASRCSPKKTTNPGCGKIL